MDDEKKDKIYKLVQAFLAYSPLIVWSSGATIPFGLPSMSQLNEEIGKQISGFDVKSDHLEKNSVEKKTSKINKKNLLFLLDNKNIGSSKL